MIFCIPLDKVHLLIGNLFKRCIILMRPLVAELLLLQASTIAWGFESGNTQLGNKRLAFAFKLSHSPGGVQCFFFWGSVLCLLQKMIILRVNDFLMILRENIYCLGAERFLWRKDISIQISMTNREDAAE